MYTLRVSEAEHQRDDFVDAIKEGDLNDGLVVRGLIATIQPPIHLDQNIVRRWFAYRDMQGPIENNANPIQEAILVDPTLVGSTGEQTTIYASTLTSNEEEFVIRRKTMLVWTQRLLNLLGADVRVDS